jgi:hypothetical protein
MERHSAGELASHLEVVEAMHERGRQKVAGHNLQERGERGERSPEDRLALHIRPRVRSVRLACLDRL